MKKLMFLLVGLLSTNSVMAESVYRPYASCVSANNNTSIEIMQNTDSKDASHPFSFNVTRMMRGNQISLKAQNAVRVPIHRKDVLEMFHGFENKTGYQFELVVFNQSPASMVGQLKASFYDVLGRSVVYCSHHITLGN